MERSEDKIRSLCTTAGIEGANVDLRRDTTRLAIIATVRRS